MIKGLQQHYGYSLGKSLGLWPLYQAGDRAGIIGGGLRYIDAIGEAVTADESEVVLMRSMNDEYALTMDVSELVVI